MKSITIDPSIRDWLIKALKESHQDEVAFHREALNRLQTELKKGKKTAWTSCISISSMGRY